MSSRLRNLNSTKISFFAFQDIITSVSGILILVVLMLATNLGVGTSPKTPALPAQTELDAKLAGLIQQQAELALRNGQLQEALSAVNLTSAAKVEKDVEDLRGKLGIEQEKLSTWQARANQKEKEAEQRDGALGLTDLRDTIQAMERDAKALAEKTLAAREQMEILVQEVARTESRLLKLKSKQGQIWLIPNAAKTTKEPILVAVDRNGISMERFDRPDLRIVLSREMAGTEFGRKLTNFRSLDQYLVFYVRPSGIRLFEEMLRTARGKGFEVGFDALEEQQQIHFSKPPDADAPDEPPAPGSMKNGTGEPTNVKVRAVANDQPSATSPPAIPEPPIVPVAITEPKPEPRLSWWQKLLCAIGFK